MFPGIVEFSYTWVSGDETQEASQKDS